MEEEHEVSLKRSEFWMRSAVLASGLLTMVITIGVSMMRETAANIAEQQKDFLARFDAYVLQIERRTTILEERQNRNLEAVSKHEIRIEVLERESPLGHPPRKPKE